MIWLKILSSLFIIIFGVWGIRKIERLFKRVKHLEKQLLKAKNDIDALHRNEKTLFLALRDTQRFLRKYAKDKKRIEPIRINKEEIQ